MRLRLPVLALVLVTASCGDDGIRQGQAPADPVAEGSPSSPAPVLDPRGQLLPSGEVVAGFPLPRGATPTIDDRRRHVYHVEAPVDALLAYVGPRVVTGVVDRVGDGAVYRAATPRDARGGVVRLDVSVMPSSRGGARLEIVELPSGSPGGAAATQRREVTQDEIERYLKTLD